MERDPVKILRKALILDLVIETLEKEIEPIEKPDDFMEEVIRTCVVEHSKAILSCIHAALEAKVSFGTIQDSNEAEGEVQ